MSGMFDDAFKTLVAVAIVIAIAAFALGAWVF